MVLSTGVPSLADKRYFLSQMSSDASWKGMASTSLCSSLTTLFMDGYLSPEVLGLLLRPLKPEPGKRKTHSPQVFAGPCVLMSVAAVRRPPFRSPAPQPSRCRDTTSCVGVGSLCS